MRRSIQGHTRGEIVRYRGLKVALGLSLLPLALYSFASEPPHLQRPRITPMPIVVTDEAMHDDYPLRWSKGGQGPLRRMGRHGLYGRGPANALVQLFEGDRIVARAKTDGYGRWRAVVTLSKPGLRTYRAQYRRNTLGAGRTRILSATVLDPHKRKESDVTVTNLGTNDRVVAGSFTLRGSAPPGDFVQIYIDSTLLGRAEVDLAGRWSFKPRVSAGGRRTFTIVDEITERQFGPLPVYVVGKAKPIAKTSAKRPHPAPVVAPRTSSPGASPNGPRPIFKARPKPRVAGKPKPARGSMVVPGRQPAKPSSLQANTAGTLAKAKAKAKVKAKSTVRPKPAVKPLKGERVYEFSKLTP